MPYEEEDTCVSYEEEDTCTCAVYPHHCDTERQRRRVGEGEGCRGGGDKKVVNIMKETY